MPVHNEEIALIFDEIADLLEIEEANPFRVRAYRNASRTIRGLGRELKQMVDSGEDLTKLPGIGKDLAGKIQEILTTGHSATLDKLHTELPATLEELLQIPGLGPKRVKALYQELHIETLAQLEATARSGKLREVPGFGEKTEQHILDSLATHHAPKQRMLHHLARQFADPLVTYLRALPGVDQVVVAGSFRRGQETVGDLDILVTTRGENRVMEHFVRYDEVKQVISRGTTRSTVVLKSGLQVDLRVVEQHSFGAALHYFTGSKAHNIEVRRLGQQRGLKINEYGVFRREGETEWLIGGETEESVFQAVGLPLILPELREGRGEIEAAQKGRLPKLIELADLTGDLHVHTKATDGHATIEEMARAAKSFGLRYIAITDHTRSLTVAKGLNEEQLARQIDEIDSLNATLQGITILKGCEIEILEDGSLDLPDTILARLDLVVGAVHSMFRLPSRKQTARLLRAINSRYFTILAHPSARLLGEREAIAVDMPRIIQAAKQRGCYLELNSQPQRLDITDIYCQAAKEAGVLLSINSDSHHTNDFSMLEGGIEQGRRGWLEKSDVLNTRPLTALRKALRATMG
ncbi:MAG TPA: DNA polymerase/3'-5' exonuclease PolX [Gammaproteobacteria bacterium]